MPVISELWSRKNILYSINFVICKTDICKVLKELRVGYGNTFICRVAVVVIKDNYYIYYIIYELQINYSTLLVTISN